MFLRFPKLSDLLLKRLKVEIFPFGSMVFVLYKNLRYKLKTTVDPTRLIGVDRSLDDALSNRRFLPSFHILLSCIFFYCIVCYVCFILIARSARQQHRSTPLGAYGWSFIKISNCLSAASKGSSRIIKTALRLFCEDFAHDLSFGLESDNKYNNRRKKSSQWRKMD